MALVERFRTQKEEILDHEGLSPRGLAILADIERLSRVYGWRRYHQKAISAFWASLGKPSPFRVIDVGTGTGWLLELAWGWARGAGVEVELAGVERSPDFAAHARRRLGDRAEIHVADALAFEARGARWHLSTSTLALHHLPVDRRGEFVAAMVRLAEASYVFDLELALVPLLTSPLMALAGVGRDTIADGILSTRRANTHREFCALVECTGARARRVMPAAQSTWPRERGA